MDDMKLVDEAIDRAAELMGKESSNLGDYKRSIPDGQGLVIEAHRGGDSVDSQMRDVFSPRGIDGRRQRV